VTALPKFWFRQQAKTAVTAYFFWQGGQIFEKICGIYMQAFEHCVVRQWNLSYSCLTSFEA